MESKGCRCSLYVWLTHLSCCYRFGSFLTFIRYVDNKAMPVAYAGERKFPFDVQIFVFSSLYACGTSRVCLSNYGRPLLGKYVPPFRHQVSRETEMHSDTNPDFLHSSFELTWIQVIHGRVEDHLTISVLMMFALQPRRFIKSTYIAGARISGGSLNSVLSSDKLRP